MPTPLTVVPPTRRRSRRVHRVRRFDDVDHHPCGVGSLPAAKRCKTLELDSPMSEEENIAAESLIMLTLSGGGFCVSSSSTDAATSASVAASIEGNQPAAADASAAVDTKKDQEPSYSADAATITVASSAAAGSTPVDEPSDTDTSPTTVRHSATNNPHQCNLCGKSFRSHQALGGHKTSHRPKPQIISTLSSDNSSRQNAIPSGKVHQCTICLQVFPTGQALGGHKRKHYDGIIGGGAASHVTVSVLRNIDLNLPPPPEFCL
ncbi:Zinc finger protein 1 [Sesamum alatum]|uniref:Zinc finger protein 1 n=1 Tax=Sesamum alatum TaxID=300844 RepID=A0AAE1Y5S2_9LAMI|nr:Zinc finger protein 1 [Sesamum alatum]